MEHSLKMRAHVMGEHIRSRVCCASYTGADGFNQTYDAVLVGADRAKDLAVLHISAPQVRLCWQLPTHIE
jgi:hypothetical protein